MHRLRSARVIAMEKLTSILVVALESSEIHQVLDKALTVARRFGAKVEVLVNDSVSAHRVTAHCAQSGYQEVTLHSVASCPEHANDTTLRRVWASRPDLLVKSPAHGGGDWELANECPVPVLLVRRGAWETPARFAAAVDVSDEENATLARAILHTAGFLALGTHGNLDILYSEREAHDESVRMQRAVRLAQLVREFHVGCERLQIFSGEPEKRLPPLVTARRYDVLVLGGQWENTGHDHAAPVTVRALMDATGGDVVLVKAPSSQLALVIGAASAWQQRPDQP